VDGDYELISVKTTLQAYDDLAVGIFDSLIVGSDFRMACNGRSKNFFLTSRQSNTCSLKRGSRYLILSVKSWVGQ
jgi:hypothetical protein